MNYYNCHFLCRYPITSSPSYKYITKHLNLHTHTHTEQIPVTIVLQKEQKYKTWTSSWPCWFSVWPQLISLAMWWCQPRFPRQKRSMEMRRARKQGVQQMVKRRIQRCRGGMLRLHQHSMECIVLRWLFCIRICLCHLDLSNFNNFVFEINVEIGRLLFFNELFCIMQKRKLFFQYEPDILTSCTQILFPHKVGLIKWRTIYWVRNSNN